MTVSDTDCVRCGPPVTPRRARSLACAVARPSHGARVLAELLFDFHPTNLFVTGVAMTASSIWLYARPDDAACISGFLKRLLAACKSDGKSELQQSNAEVV